MPQLTLGSLRLIARSADGELNYRDDLRPAVEEGPPRSARVERGSLPRSRAEPRQSCPQIVRALRNPNFRLFWSGNFLSNIGTWMQNVAQGWLVFTLTNSAFWLGVVGFAGSIPFLVFTLFGGVIADRVNKRRLLLVTQSAMMLLAFLLAALALAQDHHRLGSRRCRLLNGMAMAMNAPSYQALVPRLVQREDLTNAIALNSAQFNMSRILGPTLGGYAMAALRRGRQLLSQWPQLSGRAVGACPHKYPEQEPSPQHSVCGAACAQGFAVSAQRAADAGADVDDGSGELLRHSVPQLHPLLRQGAAARWARAAWAG